MTDDYREANAALTPDTTFGEFLTWIVKQMDAGQEDSCEFEIPGSEHGKRVMLCFDIKKMRVDP